MNMRPLPWKALLLAPLASVPATVLSGLGSSDAGIASDFFWGFLFAVTLTAPASYLAMAVVGLPAYILLRQFDFLRLWVFCAIGTLVPLALFYDSAPIRTTLTAVSCGLAASISAYFLLPRDASPMPTTRINDEA